MVTVTEKKYGKYCEDDVSTTIRTCGASIGWGSEVLVILTIQKRYGGNGERQ